MKYIRHDEPQGRISGRLLSRSTSYALTGAVLALGAPLGWKLLSTIDMGTFQTLVLYCYLTASTIFAFAIFGFLLGKKQDETALLANRDLLTGLMNQHAFFSAANLLHSIGQRQKQPVSVIVLDVDKFKSLNDSVGHLAGNAALKQLGRIFSQRSRRSDVVGRFGGDEFVFCLSGTDATQAALLAERIREEVANTKLHYAGRELQISISLGVAQSTGADGESLMRILDAADSALLTAKANGRNQVVVAS